MFALVGGRGRNRRNNTIVHSRELHGNGYNGNTVVIRGNTAAMGTTNNILPR